MIAGNDPFSQESESLDWDAWRYVSGEMPLAEREVFEGKFSDFSICEAVARQTGLFATLVVACESPQPVNVAQGLRAGQEIQGMKWGVRCLAGLAAGLLWGCLSLGLWSLNQGSDAQVRLGELWVETPQDEPVESDLLMASVDGNGGVEELFDGLEVPEWMTIGVQRDGSSSEDEMPQ